MSTTRIAVLEVSMRSGSGVAQTLTICPVAISGLLSDLEAGDWGVLNIFTPQIFPSARPPARRSPSRTTSFGEKSLIVRGEA
jgi:hypothetical protein